MYFLILDGFNYIGQKCYTQGTFSNFRMYVMVLDIMIDNNKENSVSLCKCLAFYYPLQQAHDIITFYTSQQSDGSLNLLISTEVIFARFFLTGINCFLTVRRSRMIFNERTVGI